MSEIGSLPDIQFQTPEIPTASIPREVRASAFLIPSTNTSGTEGSSRRERILGCTSRTLPGPPSPLQGCSYLWPGFFGSGSSGLKTQEVSPLGRWTVNRTPAPRRFCLQENTAGSWPRPPETERTPRSATISGEIPDSS